MPSITHSIHPLLGLFYIKASSILTGQPLGRDVETVPSLSPAVHALTCIERLIMQGILVIDHLK